MFPFVKFNRVIVGNAARKCILQMKDPPAFGLRAKRPGNDTLVYRLHTNSDIR